MMYQVSACLSWQGDVCIHIIYKIYARLVRHFVILSVIVELRNLHSLGGTEVSPDPAVPWS